MVSCDKVHGRKNTSDCPSKGKSCLIFRKRKGFEELLCVVKISPLLGFFLLIHISLRVSPNENISCAYKKEDHGMLTVCHGMRSLIQSLQETLEAFL